MCLSTVYAIGQEEKNLLFKNISSVQNENGKLLFTDIMGITTTFDGTIERMDLMDNYIYVKATE